MTQEQKTAWLDHLHDLEVLKDQWNGTEAEKDIVERFRQWALEQVRNTRTV